MSILLAVEGMHPAHVLGVGGGKGYTLHAHTAGVGKRYNKHVHTLHVLTAGDGKGFTLHVHTASYGLGNPMRVHTADSGKWYILHVQRRLLMALFLRMMLKNHKPMPECRKKSVLHRHFSRYSTVCTLYNFFAF
jgi:hypothetical protein